MKLLIGSIGWRLSVSAFLSLGGWSGGAWSWWRSWLGATLISGGVLGAGCAHTAPPWLTVCIAYAGGTSALIVDLLWYQQRARRHGVEECDATNMEAASRQQRLTVGLAPTAPALNVLGRCFMSNKLVDTRRVVGSRIEKMTPSKEFVNNFASVVD